MQAQQIIELVESILHESRYKITIEDLKSLLKKTRSYERDLISQLEYFIDYYNDPLYGKELNKILEIYSEACGEVINILKTKSVNVSTTTINIQIKQFFDKGLEAEFPTSVSEAFPIVVDLSADKDKNTISVLVYKDGKVKIFEGNDEASDKTIELINSLEDNNSEWEIVYGSHGVNTVDKILDSQILPKGLFVSPNKELASGHFSLDPNKPRELFVCKAPRDCFSRDGDTWKVIKPCKVKSIRLLHQ